VILAALSSIVMLQAAAAPAVPDAAQQKLRDKAEVCIRQNAAEVERNDSNLTDAAAFLTDYVCADSIGVFDSYVSNSRLLASMRTKFPTGGWTLYPPIARGKTPNKQMQDAQAKMAAAYRGASVNPETGRLVFAKGATEDNPYASLIEQVGDDEPMPSDPFKSLAAHAVLSAREARLAR
jgi:hypothetical protein